MILPDAAMDLRPEGPLRAAQFTEDGVCAVVDLPPFGFAWVPKEADLGRPFAVKGRPGGTRPPDPQRIDRDRDRCRDRRHPQLDSRRRIDGPAGAAACDDGIVRRTSANPSPRRCASERFELDYGGPALVQATSSGSLVDPEQGNRLASFTQRFRLWAGRPILEIDITLSDLDPPGSSGPAMPTRGRVYLACRWAWPDPSSMLRRGIFWSPEITDAERPETPEFFDISTRSQRTAVLFEGLPYHRKHGSRMLDTLLDRRPRNNAVVHAGSRAGP